MKRISYTFCIVICAIIIISTATTLGYLLNTRQAYKKNIQLLIENRNLGVFSLAYDSFLSDGMCPYSMSDIYYYIQDRPVDIIYLHRLVDPFSNDLGLINLIPIFNKTSSKWEAVLILSAGVDGKMNYEYTLSDTIFTDEINTLNLFYNSVDDLSLSLRFNPIDYFFGNKDLLVSYYNCKDSFKRTGNFKGVYNLDSLMNKLATKKASNKRLPLGRIYLVNLNADNISWKSDTVFSTSWKDYVVSFAFYDRLEANQFKQTNAQQVVGKLKNLDIENKSANFIMCMTP